MQPGGNHERLLQFLATHKAACPDCGYELRGLTAPTCPECGGLLSVERIRQGWSKGPGRAAHRIVGLILTLLAFAGIAEAFVNGATAWGRNPPTHAKVVSAMGLPLVAVLIQSHWAKARGGVEGGPAARGWFHGCLAVAVAIAGIVIGWRIVR